MGASVLKLLSAKTGLRCFFNVLKKKQNLQNLYFLIPEFYLIFLHLVHPHSVLSMSIFTEFRGLANKRGFKVV
jgi:hypothetical protein